MRVRKSALLLVSLAGVSFGVGCAPVFSDLQSAKLVGRHQVEITPSASAASLNPGEEGHFTQFSLGLSFFPGRDSRPKP